MKKILGVVGSPRKNGNTDILVSTVLAGAKAAGAQDNLIRLGELHIRECDGCHVCWNGKPCPKNDDMAALYEEINRSDGFVFGTPVYWYGPTALMKGFIDRFVYFNWEENRKGIRGKKAIIIIPFEEKDQETVDPVISFFEKTLQYLEIELIHQLIAPGVTKRGEVLNQEVIIKQAYELGKMIAR